MRFADNEIVRPVFNPIAWWPLIIGSLVVILSGHIFPFLPLKKLRLAENRVLAQAPSVPTSLQDWVALPRRLDDFVNDNFPPRTYMISTLNHVRYKLGYSGSKKVVVGRNGWLFYGTDSFARLAGKSRMDSTSMSLWLQGFKQRIDYLNRQKIKFYMMIGPVKEGLYPEHWPRWMPKEQVDTEVDDLFRLARESGYTQLVDPRPEIIAKKNEQMLYDSYDTHWTAFGGYLGYKALMTRVSQDFPDLAPLPISSFKLPPQDPSFVPQDLSSMLGISVPHERKTFMIHPPHDPARTEWLSAEQSWTAPRIMYTDSPTGKTVLLLRDSFTSELVSLFKPHFSTIIMAHLEDGAFRTDLIERYHPDMVILIVIESNMRYMMNLLPQQEEVSSTKKNLIVQK